MQVGGRFRCPLPSRRPAGRSRRARAQARLALLGFVLALAALGLLAPVCARVIGDLSADAHRIGAAHSTIHAFDELRLRYAEQQHAYHAFAYGPSAAARSAFEQASDRLLSDSIQLREGLRAQGILDTADL